MTLQVKLIILAIICAGVFGAGYKTSSHFSSGEIKSLEKQLTTLQTQIEVADQQAELTIKKQKEVRNEIEKSNADNVARINAYFKRMLHAKGSVSASSVAANTESLDGTGTEQAADRCDTEVIRGCALDANTVTMWQEWAVKNNIPVE